MSMSTAQSDSAIRSQGGNAVSGNSNGSIWIVAIVGAAVALSIYLWRKLK